MKGVKEVSLHLHKFGELTDPAKVNARTWFRQAMFDQNMKVIFDAQHIGLIIEHYDVTRYTINGYFLKNGKACALAIKDKHSPDRLTYMEAADFANKVNALGPKPNWLFKNKFDKWHGALAKLEERFLFNLLHLYLLVVKSDLAYLWEDETVDDTIIRGGWTFTRNGRRF